LPRLKCGGRSGKRRWYQNIQEGLKLQASSTANWVILRLKAENTSVESELVMSLKVVEEVSAEVPAEDFQALEEKVYRTIELYKAAKEARTVAERDVKRIREQLEEREEENESMRRELVKLRKEREEIRGRVEKMLTQMESVAQEQAAAS
jgi:hypothetical protein